jgi:hypothetical protein
MKLLAGIIIGVLGVLGYQKFQERQPPAPVEFEDSSAVTAQPAPARSAHDEFQCDGRQHCSQMRNCEEAEFFLRNCPDVKMDGDEDGRPCEEKCGH